jgi:predicted TIM-barrel fold metal-dependent hydrolase
MAGPLIVDSDGHVIEPASVWVDYLDPKYHSRAPKRVKDDQGRDVVMLDGKLLPAASQFSQKGKTQGAVTLRAGGYDPRERIKDLDAEEIDIAVLYPTTSLRIAGLTDPELAAALCGAYNDWLADFCRVDPKRLIGVGLVPILDVDAAIAEAQRAVGELGFRGIFLRPNPVSGRNWFHPAYEPFWYAVEEMGVPIGFHEGTTMNVPTAGADRFVLHWHQHMISHPHEQQIALMSLIAGGVMERHPKLRFAFLESGAGWIAHWLERMDEHVEYFDWEVEGLTLTPTEYFLRQGFIAGDPTERAIPAMAALVGDHVIGWATDYPHPDAIFPGAARAIRDRTDIPEESKRKILGENAAKFYGLDV